MTVSDGCCDFCGGGQGHLLSTGDETSVFFYVDEETPRLWCGVCREGSLVYFERFTTVRLVELMDKSIQVLKDDPIRWEGPRDDPKTHLRKIYINDEIGRARQELRFRSDENVRTEEG